MPRICYFMARLPLVLLSLLYFDDVGAFRNALRRTTISTPTTTLFRKVKLDMMSTELGLVYKPSDFGLKSVGMPRVMKPGEQGNIFECEAVEIHTHTHSYIHAHNQSCKSITDALCTCRHRLADMVPRSDR